MIEFNLPGLAIAILSGMLTLLINKGLARFMPYPGDAWAFGIQMWTAFAGLLGLGWTSFLRYAEPYFGMRFLPLWTWSIITQVFVVFFWIYYADNHYGPLFHQRFLVYFTTGSVSIALTVIPVWLLYRKGVPVGID